MRVTDQQIFGLVLGNMQRTRERLLIAQERISSQKRVTKPSDDPAAFGQMVLGKAGLAEAEQYLRNIQFASARLDAADGALVQVSTLLGRIKELAVGARSETKTAGDRSHIAQEVRQLHRQLLQLANSEINGQALFAGTKTDLSPFVLGVGDDVTYQGNNETQSIQVGTNETTQVTVPGDEIFTGPTINVFDAIRDLLSALENNDSAGIEAGIGAMDDALTQVADAQGRIGAMANRVESTSMMLGQVRDVLTTVISQQEDMDLAKAVSDLARQQVAIQATAEAASRLFESSLLPFLK